ncbi:MAG: hypothetical protein FRX48_02181 [Lasallia pustulata]|uniref:Uncharacterized protein n=1 Tax=Lasallia pustulata TaxID=136370 RepID=A0A5M8PXJ8_9LECA|nr:MAG: hypothetical protein FRX48_02181 [Lasallia pustulata]
MNRPEIQSNQLTPVRIRGKRIRGRSHQKKSTEDSPAIESSRPRGRPPKRLSTAAGLASSHSTASSSVSGCTKRRRRGAKTPREVILSPLECLPVELLQTIFLYSLNLALPRSSPRLGSALLSKHVKMELVIRTFCICDTVNAFAGSHTYAIDPGDAEEVERNANMQSGVFHLKWMTLDIFRESIDKFLIRTAAREFRNRSTTYGAEESLPTEAEYRRLLEDGHLCGDTWCENPQSQTDGWFGEPTSCRFRNLSMRLRGGRLLTLEMNRLAIGLNMQMLQLCPDGIHFCSEIVTMLRQNWRISCYVPSRLLHGPWTNEKCDFLELLLKMGVLVDLLDREIAEKGLEDAIRERNIRALRLLKPFHELHDFERSREQESGAEGEYERGHIIQEFESHECVCVSIPNRWHAGVFPSTSHLRLAVIECDCPPDIVYHLLSGRICRVDLEDRELVSWAVERKKHGDWRGKWLLKLLRRAWVDHTENCDHT